VGSRDYAMRYFFKDLSVALLGAHSKDHVTVSRYYMTLDPKIVVDFEPDPREQPFYVDEKGKYFLEHRIVYVPIYLIDRLSAEQFEERVKAAKAYTARGVWEQKIDESLSEVEIEGIVATPAADQWINREVHARYDEYKKTNPRPDLLKGFIEQKILQRLKREVIRGLRDRIKKQLSRTYGRYSVTPRPTSSSFAATPPHLRME
jgi:hypothetical protein